MSELFLLIEKREWKTCVKCLCDRTVDSSRDGGLSESNIGGGCIVEAGRLLYLVWLSPCVGPETSGDQEGEVLD